MNSKARLDVTLYQALFVGWRLIYVPANIVARSGHGLTLLTAAAGLLLVFGGEWLRRRTGNQPDVPADVRTAQQRRSLWMVVIGLVLLGFFPEEGPISLILLAGIGVAWGDVSRTWPSLPHNSRSWFALLFGGLMGIMGLWGPGSWLMAALLLPLVAHFRGTDGE